MTADGSVEFPIVLVGGVLVANQNWDIGQKVVDRLIKTYPGAYPVRPKVSQLPDHIFAFYGKSLDYYVMCLFRLFVISFSLLSSVAYGVLS